MATSMLTYYVKTDSETKFVTDIQLEEADGFTPVFVLPSSVQWFTRYYAHYKVQNGVAAPADGALPDLSIDYLMKIIDSQALQIKQAQDSLDTANTTLTQLKSMSGSLNGQVAQANQTITALQGLVGTLTGQIAQMKVSQTTTATTE